MSWLERTVAGLATLPEEVNESLMKIREHGFRNRQEVSEISEEETRLLQELQEAIKEGGEIDENSIKVQADSLVLKRKNLSAEMDLQLKTASHLYDRCGESLLRRIRDSI